MAEAFARFEGVDPPRTDSPWDGASFLADLDRLEKLIGRCATGEDEWADQTGGALGRALDLWAADELRRAAYEPDAVWPRAVTPRVLPASVARAISRLSKSNRETPAAKQIEASAGRAKATVFGEFFPKEVDVLVADWDRGIELMISTKSMTGSYGNNMKNRWEEFVGDLRNIRGRHPLAVLGVLFMADRSILADNAYDRLIDMLRKLRLESASGPAYDGTALVIAHATGEDSAALDIDSVPEDLRPSQMFEALLDAAFTRLPTTERQAARDLYQAAQLPTVEAAAPEQVGLPSVASATPDEESPRAARAAQAEG